jgi:prevent-host-death family protein
MERVGVRELRQNLSVYLRRIRERGEPIEVTEHGRPVAVLSPLNGEQDPYEQMIADGRLKPATRSLADLPPPLVGPTPTAGTDALQAQREDRI